MRLRKILFAGGLAALVAMALPLRAQTGCDDSPEDPTIVLALVGSAGMIGAKHWKARRRKRWLHTNIEGINRRNQPAGNANSLSRIHRQKAADLAPKRSTKLRRRQQDSAFRSSPEPTSQIVWQGALGTEQLAHEPNPIRNGLSPWSGSAAKRVFDAGCALLALPVLAPLVLFVAATVWITSPGPVLFRQKRVGRNGRIFTIFKFRTLVHAPMGPHRPITTLENQSFTPVGPFLRRWKLDELPQLANVLLGHMSLVGPRPKMPEHTIFHLCCRPGLTGLATLAFADEEAMLSRVCGDELDAFYRNVVLPAKHKIDSEYLARATFRSDVELLFRSVLRRWDATASEGLPAAIADIRPANLRIPA